MTNFAPSLNLLIAVSLAVPLIAQNAQPGALVSVGEHRLFIACDGARSGRPTVVLEAGGGGTSEEWAGVRARLGQDVRACAYDRAGLGRSEAGPQPRTLRQEAFELHALLRASGEIELLAGDAPAAERAFHEAYETLERGQDWGHLASVAPLLALSLLEQGPRFDVISIGFVLALWSGSRALHVIVDTITIMYGLNGHRGVVRARILSFSLYVMGLVTGIVAIPLILAGPSLVDEALRRDPAGAYTRMDFLSRDRQRRAIESLAPMSGPEQVDVALTATELARDATATHAIGERETHVGYYLVDRGRTAQSGACTCG